MDHDVGILRHAHAPAAESHDGCGTGGDSFNATSHVQRLDEVENGERIKDASARAVDVKDDLLVLVRR
jgi:hypothetical protein